MIIFLCYLIIRNMEVFFKLNEKKKLIKKKEDIINSQYSLEDKIDILEKKIKKINEENKNKEEEKKKGEVLDKGQKSFLTIISAVFLMLLAISSNFIGDTLTCQTKKILNHNIYVKFFVIYCIIYFAMSLSAQANNSPIHPFKLTFVSFIIFVFYILFIKCNIFFVITTVIILFILLVLTNYAYYYNNNTGYNYTQRLKMVKYISKIFKLLLSFVFLLILFGFIIYSKNQYNCKKSILDFVFNKTIC